MWATLKRLAVVLGFAFATGQAFAQSTINTSIPAANAPLQSAPIRANFLAAASDINGIISGHPAANLGGCPSTPTVFEDCLVVGSPYQWFKWTGSTGNWGLIGSINPSTGLFSFALNAGNVSGTSPIAVTFPGGVATVGLSYSTGLAVSGGNLVVQPVTINGTPCQPGSTCTITAAVALVNNSTTISGGTSGRILYDNSGVLGEATVTGSLGSVVLSASPTLTGTINAANITLSGVLKATGTSSINGNAASLPAFGSWFTAQQFVINNQDGTGQNGIAIFNYAGGPGSLTLLSAAGTGASSTATQSGNSLGHVEAWGFDGTNYDISAYISFVSTQNFTSSHLGSQIKIFTTPNNSNTNTLALTIGQDQSLTVAGPVSASNLLLGGMLTISAALTTTGAGAPTLAFPVSGFTYTFPGAAANLAYQVGSFTNGHCLQASGTAGGIADAGSACGSGGSTTITANSTPTSGFSAGQFIYSDGSLVQAAAGVTYNGAGQVTLALGTITTNLKAINITGTFNASGTTFDAPLFMNITNTAAAVGSLIADLQIGGVTAFGVYTQAGVLGGNSAPMVLINATGLAPWTADYSSHDILDIQGLGGIHVHGIGNPALIFLHTIYGTVASPAATTINQTIGTVSFQSYDGGTPSGANNTGAEINGLAAENWGPTAHGGYLIFSTTPTGTITGLGVLQLQASGGASLGHAFIGTDPGSGNMLLGGGQLWLQGASTGYTVLTSANSGASNFTATLPAATDTVAELTQTQTLTNKTIAFSSNTLTGVAPLASPTFTGTITGPDSGTWGSGGINGSIIGGTTRAAGSFTTLAANSTANFTGTFEINGNVITWPAAAISVARVDAAQTFLGVQTIQASGASGSNATIAITPSTVTSGSNSIKITNDTGSVANHYINNSATTNSNLSNVPSSAVLTGGASSTGLYVGTTVNASPVVIFAGGIVTATNIAINIVSPTNIQFPHTPSDSGKTDTAACLDSTTFQLYTGSGTLGVCLGTSSERYKHGIADLNVGLGAIMGLRSVSYYPNEGHGDPNKMLYGFTAEQGITVLPQLAGLDDQGRPNTFDYLGVVPVLVRAMQELKADNDNLRAELQRRVAR